MRTQTAPFGGDTGKRDFELRAAIAAEAMKHITGQALGVDADQRRAAGGEIAHLQHDRLFGAVSPFAFESVDPKGTKLRRKIGFGHLVQARLWGFLHKAVLGNL